MTEAEWLICEDSRDLIEYLWELRASTKRLPAFVASFADAGRVGPLCTAEVKPAFDAYVRWVREGGPHPSELFPAFRSRPWGQGIDTWHVDDTIGMLCARPDTRGSWLVVYSAILAESFGRSSGSAFDQATAESYPWFSDQAKRLRDIFGNPFRPVMFTPAWRTEVAVGISAKMYDSREFGNLPVLADALQDAGCEDAAVLDHCREPGPHVRGCWVVDLVLGKA